EIQSSDRMQARQPFGKQIRDERSSFRIRERREITLWLVQQYVDFFCMRQAWVYQFAADFDVIFGWISLCTKGSYYFAVDHDFARRDHLFGMSSRRQSGRGNYLL